jgi:hypothetical protein
MEKGGECSEDYPDAALQQADGGCGINNRKRE